MKKFKSYEGLKKRLGALALTAFMAVAAAPEAKADTAAANAVLDAQELIYSEEDSKATNLVVNSKDVLTELAVNGKLPFEYRNMVITPELTLYSENKMREVILNANFYNLFNDRDNFEYLSMGVLYMDNEEEKALFTELAGMIQEFSLSPTMAGLQNIMDFIRMYTPLFSAGGKQAVGTDLFFLQAMAQVFGLTENELGDKYTQLDDMAASFGQNADIIAYLNAMNGQANCR